MLLSFLAIGCYTAAPDSGYTKSEDTDTGPAQGGGGGGDTDSGQGGGGDTDSGQGGGGDTDSGQGGGGDTDSGGDTDTAPVATEHCGDLTADETWGPGDHLVTCSIAVDGVTLRIEAGAVVRFAASTYLDVGKDTDAGALVVAGTAEQPVTLEGESAGSGAWQGLRGHGTATLSLSHTAVVDGGSTHGALYLAGGTLTVDGVTITGAGGHGVELTDDAAFGAGSTGLDVLAPGDLPVVVDADEADGVPDGVYEGDGIGVEGGTISHDATWSDLGVPWIVLGDLDVEGSAFAPASLTLDAGTTVGFDSGAGLTVAKSGGAGSLHAAGTSSARVTLTAYGAAVEGYWDGVRAYLGTDVLELDHTDVSWGGSTAALRVAAADVALTDVTLSGSAGSGFLLEDGARFAAGSSGLVSTANAAPGELEAMAVDAFTNLDASLSGNTTDVLYVDAGDDITASIRWPALDVPYWLSDSLDVEGTSMAPAVWTVDPGVTVYVAADKYIRVAYGGGAAALYAVGTDTAPIVFTAGGSAVAGSWGGVGLYDDAVDASCVLDHVEVGYAGGTSLSGDLHLDAADPTIDHAYVHDSEDYGIYTKNGATPTLGTVTYAGNVKGDYF